MKHNPLPSKAVPQMHSLHGPQLKIIPAAQGLAPAGQVRIGRQLPLQLLSPAGQPQLVPVQTPPSGQVTQLPPQQDWPLLQSESAQHSVHLRSSQSCCPVWQVQ